MTTSTDDEATTGDHARNGVSSAKAAASSAAASEVEPLIGQAEAAGAIRTGVERAFSGLA